MEALLVGFHEGWGRNYEERLVENTTDNPFLSPP